jgi:hypothetical protein
MKVCPNCQTKYPDDANFCPQETCATPEGPRRLDIISAAPAARYEMQGQVGGGRSGEVFRARDLQSGATVMYKRVTRVVLTSPAVVERSQRELKQLQRAQSPRLAKILDFGKEPDGQLFVVSELVDGQTLDKVVAASGPFSLERAKKIAAQIGEALLEGQKVGVVHHDLAPKNVLIGTDDQVKVINFVAPVPVTETVFGVAEYLSPEQAEGKLVDQRSNTYSLGGILLFMLTGETPVEGATPAAVLEQVLKGSVVPPSLRTQGLSAEIDRVVMKAMDKSPNRRPLTLRQFLTDVAGMLAPGQPAPSAGVGFAKTMMFAGGSPEAQKLVNQALAARAEANGAAPPATGPNVTQPIAMVAAEVPPVEQATPPPVARPTGSEPVGPRRTHGAAIAATMVALPAAGKVPGGVPGAVGRPADAADSGAMQPTPPPVAATPPPVAATPPPVAAAPTAGAAPGKPGGAAAFRETLWFKQGDVDQMVADARAKLESSRKVGAPAPEPELPPADTKPLEDRYRDDGSVSVEDRKKYSLRSGGTAAGLPTVGGAMPGERMSAEEMMGEIGGGKRVGIIVVAVAAVLAIIVVLVMMFRGRHVEQSAAALTPVTVPTEPTPAPPPPPPAPPAAAAPAPAAPAAAAPAKPAAAAPAAAAEEEEEAAPKAPPHASGGGKKHAAAKKAKKKHH